MKKYIEFGQDGALKARLIEGIHTITKAAVLVPDDLWLQTIKETDGVWKIDSAGTISKHPLVSDFDAQAAERAWRDTELTRIAGFRDRHRDELDMQRPTTFTAEQFSDLLGYMQALRDWPTSNLFPDAQQRPAAPTFLDM
ncbi:MULTISPECIES: phage tail assembly chaperone [unclassified Pseudomonas]|uniref:phage tail assembly chaperone n=1 Tax=unclassified Pseudomonas TaxID=196821 RepID=UPI0024490949|nr:MULTISPECIES: phage tail assembly chaperone [unclassified Pseudomonas]MDH0301244.1 phage tail assembly chaperone [Pseudomonas sp. GD04091]MDH1984686.1 phage tail assembly chaperone [Pseudomonas sp. GD03689]